MNPHKKYLVYGGVVISRTDAQMHAVNPHQVARLYGVRGSECIFITHDEWLRGGNSILRQYKKSFVDSLVVLQPRNDGDYDLNKRIKEQTQC